MKCRSLSFMWLFWSWRSFEKSVVDDTVRASGESEDMGDEVMFVVVHAVVPVVEIFCRVHLGRTERCLSFLIHLPNLRTGLSIITT